MEEETKTITKFFISMNLIDLILMSSKMRKKWEEKTEPTDFSKNFRSKKNNFNLNKKFSRNREKIRKLKIKRKAFGKSMNNGGIRVRVILKTFSVSEWQKDQKSSPKEKKKSIPLQIPENPWPRVILSWPSTGTRINDVELISRNRKWIVY